MSWAHHNSTSLFGIGLAFCRARKDSRFGTIARADVEPKPSTATRVVPHQTCEDAGWSGTVGMIHSHPGGERCWYFFPGTQVASSDGQSFAGQPYPVDAIMCGDHVVWINRDMAEMQLKLPADIDRPLRRGAWYHVKRLGPREALLDVLGEAVDVPRPLLDIISRPPYRWSVVPRPKNPSRFPGVTEYGVCPNCRERVPLTERH